MISTRKRTMRTRIFSQLNVILAIILLIFGIIRTKIFYGAFFTSIAKISMFYFLITAILWFLNGYFGTSMRFKYCRFITFFLVVASALHIAGSFFLVYTLSIFAAGSWFAQWLRLAWPSIILLLWALYFSWQLTHSDPRSLKKKRHRSGSGSYEKRRRSAKSRKSKASSRYHDTRNDPYTRYR